MLTDSLVKFDWYCASCEESALTSVCTPAAPAGEAPGEAAAAAVPACRRVRGAGLPHRRAHFGGRHPVRDGHRRRGDLQARAGDLLHTVSTRPHSSTAKLNCLPEHAKDSQRISEQKRHSPLW